MISTERVLYYPMLLLLSTESHKTAETLAGILNMSGDTVLRILKNECITSEELIDSAKEQFGMNKVYVIVDDSLIKKIYSNYIEGSSDNYDTVTKKTHRSLCPVVAMITDGKRGLPVSHKLWVNKEFCSEGEHQTNIKIAQELIQKLIPTITIKMVLMDGLYSSIDMIKWLQVRSLPFEMRFHSNRMVSCDPNNPRAPLKLGKGRD